jgi:hypothetical protein
LVAVTTQDPAVEAPVDGGEHELAVGTCHPCVQLRTLVARAMKARQMTPARATVAPTKTRLMVSERMATTSGYIVRPHI